jgi:signal-transduction protein with cAMP-binding, CBS, and nucleotidyltransferase domain
MEIHKDIYETIDFFKDKPQEFVGWCVPMLKIMVYHDDQYIYTEGDSINFLYFIEKGTAGFVLPRYHNAIYIVIERGDYFGVIDLVPVREKKGKLDFDNGGTQELKRVFTV